MEKAATVLGRALRRVNRPEAAIAWLQSTWPQVVGRLLAAHTRPVRCVNGKLEVSVDAKPWQSQVEGFENTLRARINEAWGRVLVRELLFATPRTPPSRIPRELDINHTPFVRRRKP